MKFIANIFWTLIKFTITLVIDWWQQIIGIPIALTLFFLVPSLLRMVDPTAAAFDAGILHSANAVFALLLIFNGLAWVGVIASFPTIAGFFKKHLKNTFNTLSPWQKCCLSFSALFFYLLMFVLLALAVL